MKTLHFASIFVLAAATTFACNDEEDRAPNGAAGSSGAAGKNSGAGNPSAGKDPGEAGAAGSLSDAGMGGASAGASNDNRGGAGAGGENQGGDFGGGGAGGAGGTSEPDASAGGEGGEGGAGGAPEVPDVVVAGPTELIGTWSTNFGGTEVITATTWNGANMVAYTTGVTVVYTQNRASDQYNPNKFSKYVYTQPVSGSFYFCQIVYDAATLAAAQADTKVANVNALETNGCSSFPWTKATKATNQ